MGYSEAIVTPQQSRSVEAVWSYVATSSGRGVILPDGRCDLILRFREGQRGTVQPVVTGPATQPYEIRYAAGDGWVGVRVRPERGVAVWGKAIRAAKDQVRRGAEAVTLVPALAELVDMAPREAELRAGLLDVPDVLAYRDVDARVARTVQQIHLTGGRVSVTDLAARVGVTARHLGRLFQSSVGLGVKTYIGLVRFHRALRLAVRGGVSLSEVAFEAGFADQAHLSRAVRRFGGISPGRVPPELILPGVAGSGQGLFGAAGQF
ncbi:Transcriptional activator NphR [Shimia sp. SK013]|uniref:helix-turn-helix domain-containing protein n=1 Tax=Shimia sp. SK013 TaxID=1389006 RepID=UPI0006B6002C|nr:helix-turn-helix transcriptional regulator [Shimia sp. SK013]KPA23600.1 Transcriptional activator NphR [Shimia sp. SK013]